jgi:hypothetical protein
LPGKLPDAVISAPAGCGLNNVETSAAGATSTMTTLDRTCNLNPSFQYTV